MELGGWKSYEMVLRYAHLAPDHLSHAAARHRANVENRRAKLYENPTLGFEEDGRERVSL